MRQLVLTLPMLLVSACMGSDDRGLFSDGSSSSGGSNPGHAAGAAALPDSTSDGYSGNSSGGRAAAGAGAGAGNADVLGDGNAGSSAGALTVPGSAAGASGAGGSANAITSCSEVADAATFPESGHCYAVTNENLSFDAASAACSARGAHLVTIASVRENQFVAALHDGAHWIGATDGRDERAAGAGTYAWIDSEPWVFTAWDNGQPNATATDCPDENGGAHCYEHCAFQSPGGGWNDRACFHTIVSICEWDFELDASGDAGAAGNGAWPAP